MKNDTERNPFATNARVAIILDTNSKILSKEYMLDPNVTKRTTVNVTLIATEATNSFKYGGDNVKRFLKGSHQLISSPVSSDVRKVKSYN